MVHHAALEHRAPLAAGYDADFDPQRFSARYQADLANNLGNLLQRVTAMIGRYCAGQVPEPADGGPAEQELRRRFADLPNQVFAQVEGFAVQQALAAVMDALTAANQYLETASPWKRARAGESAAVAASLYCAAEAVRIAALLLTPVLPERSAEALRRLGCPADASQAGGLAWGGLAPGSPVSSGDPLFPRLE